VEVVASVEVLDEARVGRFPVEQLAGEGTRGRGVEGQEEGQEAEVLLGLLGFDRDDREVEVAASRPRG
jgi:hypothetical protein